MLDVSGTQSAQQPPVVPPKTNLASIDDSSHLQEIMPALLVVIVAAVTLVVFFLGRSYATQAQRQQAQYTALAAEFDVAPLAGVSTKATQLSQSLQVLHKATQKQMIWSKLLLDLQLTTQPNITLSTLSVDQKNLLKIDGKADSYPAVATYLATLRSSPLVSEANLISAQLADTGNGRVAFALEVQFKADQLLPTATAAPTTAPTSPAATGGSQ